MDLEVGLDEAVEEDLACDAGRRAPEGSGGDEILCLKEPAVLSSGGEGEPLVRFKACNPSLS